MENEPEVAVKAKPGIDIRATLKGIVRRLPILFICLAVALFFALRMRHHKSHGKYTSETIVEFRPAPEDVLNTNPQTLLQTLKDTVKLRENVEQVRTRLGLKASADLIGKALDVQVEKNTMLLVFGATWENPQTAADMANTLRDVFISHYSDSSKENLNKRQKDTNHRIQDVADRLARADSDLQHFTTANQIVDIDRQSGALLDEFNSYGLQLEIAIADQRTVEEQARKLDGVISDLKKKVDQESKSLTNFESLHDMNVRIQNLRDAMRDDREHRLNTTELAHLKDEMDRMKLLHTQGAISDLEYQRSVTAYEKGKILAIDTDQIKAWKVELDKLEKVFIPTNEQTSASAPLLHDMLAKMFYIQLDRIGVEQKVASLTTARAKVRAELDNIPHLRERFDALKREIAGAEKERKDLEASSAQVSQLGALRDTQFQIVETAQAETPEKKLNLLPIMIGAGGFVVGLILIVVLELLDRTVRSAAEVDHRLQMALIGWLPKRKSGTHLIITPSDPMASDRLTLASRKVRQLIPEKGARIAMMGTGPGEGVTSVAANLALSFARQGERVLLIDLQSSRKRGQHSPTEIIQPSNAPQPDIGLAAYLTDSTLSETAAIHPTGTDNVFCLPRNEQTISPDLLASQRMAKLLDYASQQFSIVLLDMPPVLDGAETELLTHHANAAVFVVKSQHEKAATIKRALEKISHLGVPIAGVILNGIAKRYQVKE